MSGARRAALPAALLGLLTCLLFLPALAPSATFYFRDASQNHRPFRQLTAVMLEQDETPLWNPLRGAGQPLLANPNALILHPTTLLLLALPLEAALEASVILQVFLAALGAWLVLRDLGAGRAASLLGGATFGFSGYMVSLGNLLNVLDAAAFLPLSLWLCGRVVRRGFTGWGPLAALSLAVQLAAAEPAVLIATVIAAAALAAGPWRDPDPAAPDGGRPRPARLASVAVLAPALAALALLPAAELVPLSERGSAATPAPAAETPASAPGPPDALKWSQPPVAMLEVILPELFGDPTRTSVRRFWGGGVHDAGLPLILSLYLGPGVLALAWHGLAAGWRAGGGRRACAVALASAGLLGAVFALGRYTPLYPILHRLPPLSLARYPVKFFLLASWSASLLAALGYDAVTRARGSRTSRLRAAGPALACLLAPLAVLAVAQGAGLPSRLGLPQAVVTPEAEGSIRAGIARSSLRSAGAAGAVAAALAWAPAPAARLLLLALPVADLILATRHLNPTAPASFYDRPPDLLPLVVAAGGGGRVWAAPRPRGFAFKAPQDPDADSLVWGFRWDRMTLRNATYFDTGLRFAFDRGNERLDVMPAAGVARRLAASVERREDLAQTARLLSLAGVDRAVVYGDTALPGFHEAARLEGSSIPPVVILRNESFLPRARIVRDAETVASPEEALRRLRDADFDPSRIVLLEPTAAGRPERAATALEDPRASQEQDRVHVVEESAGRIVLETSSGAGGWLVLADTFYPGWVARIGRERTPIARAYAMFRAVRLPAGTHTVTFLYQPSSVRTGLVVSAGALLAAGLLALPGRRR